MQTNTDLEDVPEDYPCVLCKGLGVTPWPVQELRGFVDGPQFLTTTVVMHATGFAGLGPLQTPETFAQILALREAEHLIDWDDDLLSTYQTRLRRQLVMLTEDQADGWWADSLRRRYERAEREIAWRKRANEKGAAPFRDTGRWHARVERVKTETDLALLIAFESVQARPNGTSGWVCCCPFHQDSHPSLNIDTVKNLWYCHVCAIGGDALTFVQMRTGKSFAEAVIHLEERLGLGTA